MSKRHLLASTTFAHLIGLRRPAAEKPPQQSAAAPDPDDVEDEERKRREDETDDEYQARMDALDANAAVDPDDEDNKDDEDDDDKKDDKDAKASAARARERARCAAIFGTAAAAQRPDVAAHLAFGTNLPRQAAISTLKAVALGERRYVSKLNTAPTPPPPASAANDRSPRADLYARMALEPTRELGTGSEGARPDLNDPEQFANAVAAAGRKRRGER